MLRSRSFKVKKVGEIRAGPLGPGSWVLGLGLWVQLCKVAPLSAARSPAAR
jgi:hypothetical protein